jgi:hypothetical protein
MLCVVVTREAVSGAVGVADGEIELAPESPRSSFTASRAFSRRVDQAVCIEAAEALLAPALVPRLVVDAGIE